MSEKLHVRLDYCDFHEAHLLIHSRVGNARGDKTIELQIGQEKVLNMPEELFEQSTVETAGDDSKLTAGDPHNTDFDPFADNDKVAQLEEKVSKLEDDLQAQKNANDNFFSDYYAVILESLSAKEVNDLYELQKSRYDNVPEDASNKEERMDALNKHFNELEIEEQEAVLKELRG